MENPGGANAHWPARSWSMAQALFEPAPVLFLPGLHVKSDAVLTAFRASSSSSLFDSSAGTVDHAVGSGEDTWKAPPRPYQLTLLRGPIRGAVLLPCVLVPE